MKNLRIFAALASTVAMVACSPTDDISILPAPLPYELPAENLQGRMMGDLPVVGTFDERETRGFGILSTDFLQLEIHATGDYGWAMVGVFAMIDTETGEVVVDPGSVIGCSGPDPYFTEFDEPAEVVDIIVEPIVIGGEDYLEVEIIAEFSGSGIVEAVAIVPVTERPEAYID